MSESQSQSGQQITVNIDLIRQSRIHIAMPCYGGQLTESTFMSFIKWANTARQLGIDWVVETMTNESLISRARNTLVAKFLDNPQTTHLMFIDADIGFEPWHILALINHDLDVVGGLYPMKTLPVKWCVNGIPGAREDDPSGLIEVTKTGTGFMLIKRSVFEKLNQHPAVKSFANDIGLPPELNQHMKTYFDTTVRENRYYSEDWTFCENWRDLGGRVFVDRRVLLRHTGTHVFDFASQPKLYEDLYTLFGGKTPAEIMPPQTNSNQNTAVQPTAPTVPQAEAAQPTAPTVPQAEAAQPAEQSQDQPPVLAEIFATNRSQPIPN